MPTPINARKAQLTAVNEALKCLDFDSVGATDLDEQVSDVIDQLLDIRSRLTSKPWPEMPAIPEAQRDAWLDARAFEQMQDGRR